MGGERAPTPAPSDDEPMPDGAEPSRLAKSAGDRRPARCGAWNAQAARMLQDGVLAARLGGGGTVTVTYGNIVMAVEVRHERAAGPPALVSATQELRLRALEAQQRQQESAAARAAAEQRRVADEQQRRQLAKREKRKRQRERRRVRDREQLEAARAARVDSQPEDGTARAREVLTEAIDTVAAVVGHITARTAHVVRASGGPSPVKRVLEGLGQRFAVEVPKGTKAAHMPAALLFDVIAKCPGPLVPGAAEAFERVAARLFAPMPTSLPVEKPPLSMSVNWPDVSPPGL